MHTLADIMFGRGIAEATFLTIARHTTIDPHTTLLPDATRAGFDSPEQYDAVLYCATRPFPSRASL